MKNKIIIGAFLVVGAFSLAAGNVSTSLAGTVSKPSNIQFAGFQKGATNYTEGFTAAEAASLTLIEGELTGTLNHPLIDPQMGGEINPALVYSGLPALSNPILEGSTYYNNAYFRLIDTNLQADTQENVHIEIAMDVTELNETYFDDAVGLSGFVGSKQMVLSINETGMLAPLTFTENVTVYHDLESAQVSASASDNYLSVQQFFYNGRGNANAHLSQTLLINAV